MGDWSTYELADFLMFSARTWYRQLALHNEAWFPLHAMTAAVGVAMATRRGIPMLLALCGVCWLFVAWAFHWQRYAPINWAANYFATAFVLQAVLLGSAAWMLHRQPARVPAPRGIALGSSLLVAAGLCYPLVALAAGRPFASSEWFGLMPDPTALATLGFVAGISMPQPWRATLMTIPLLWCAIAGATLWTLKAPEWFLLPVAGVAAILMVMRRRASP